MQGRVLRETDVPGRLAYAKSRRSLRHLKLLRIVVRTRGHSFSLRRQQLAIILRNRVLRCLGIVRLQNHVLRHVMARTDCSPEVKVLLHTFVAYSFVLIIGIEKRMRLVLIHLRILAHVRQRLLDVVIVLRAWGHSLGANPCEVKLRSVSNSFLIDLVLVPWLVDQVLNGQLGLQLGNARWQLESSILALTVVQILKVVIIMLVIVAVWRRRLSCQVVIIVSFEPAELVPSLEGPFWVRFLI